MFFHFFEPLNARVYYEYCKPVASHYFLYCQSSATIFKNHHPKLFTHKLRNMSWFKWMVLKVNSHRILNEVNFTVSPCILINWILHTN
jgi:hypothetical protein